MSKVDDLISQIDTDAKNPKKAELWDLIKSSLEQINEINNLYKEYFEGSEGSEALLNTIENKVKNITELYTKLFPMGESDSSVVDKIQNQVDSIRKYHEELLTNPNSIKSDVQNSQDKITKFYVELFGSDGTLGNAKTIRDFYDKLTSPDGIEKEIERAYSEVIEKYEELFLAPKGEESKIEKIETNIKKIDLFKNKVDKEITPEIETVRKNIVELETDLKTKQTDLDALLSDATVRSLLEAYTESKSEYSKFKRRSYSDKKFTKKIPVFLFNNIGRYFSSLLNYSMFILPLVAVSFIFVNESTAKMVLESLGSNNGANPSAAELIYVKTVISIPLVWIAWYGQRNISQRKRLFEEYNHKLRVVQMYLLFNTSDKTYYLSESNKDKLSMVLLDAIQNNPAEYLGKGETIIDRLFDKFRLEGYYTKLKEEILFDLKDNKNE